MIPILAVIAQLVPIVPSVLKMLGHDEEAETAEEVSKNLQKTQFLEQIKKLSADLMTASGHGALAATAEQPATGQAAKVAEKAVSTVLDADPALKQKIIDAITQASSQKLDEIREQNRSIEAQQQIAIERLREEAESAHKMREDERAAFAQTMESQVAARTANQSAVSAGTIPTWFVPVFSLLIASFFCYVIYRLMGAETIIHEKNRDILNIVLGAFGTAFATIIGYHFGSSSGSKSKDETLKQAVENVQANPSRVYAADGSLGTREPSRDLSSVTPLGAATPGSTGRVIGSFETTAPVMMDDLIKDLGLTVDQAAGVLANIGVECNGFRTMQEIRPTVPGSRGGYGICQWTGPRRRTFEAYASARSLKIDSYEANYGFLLHELRTTERNALSFLRTATNVKEATRLFMEKFERPGVLHLDGRYAYAARALRAYNDVRAKG